MKISLDDLEWELREVDFNVTPAVVTEMRHAAANGWTISVVKDLHPALADVAAFPTEDDSKDVRWFDFDGHISVRCYSHHDVQECVRKVVEAKSPREILDADPALFEPCEANMEGAPWTEEEMDRLVKIYAAVGARGAAKVLGRTAYACQSQVTKMKSDMNVPHRLRKAANAIPNRRGVVAAEQRRKA